LSEVSRRDDLTAVEHWFVTSGVPHFIDRYRARTDIWTRALPILVIAYVLGGLVALDVEHWSLARNLAALAVVVAVLVAAWAITNIGRGRPWFSRPREVGKPELVAFVIGPSLPALIFGQYGDALQAVITGIAVLVVIYFATSYAVVPMLRWAFGRATAQVLSLANLVVRALPLLLLFTTFLFLNTEVWQVAGTLYGPVYWLTLSIFFVLGVLFVLSRLPRLLRDLSAFPTWTEVGDLLDGTPAADIDVPTAGNPEQLPLKMRQKINVGLLMLFSQALQVTFVVILLVTFFILFGFVAISAATSMTWLQTADVHVLLRWHVGGRELVVTEPLLRVAGFLGAFSGMYFTVVLATDATYRDEFAEDVRPQIHQLFAVRLAYNWSLRYASVGNA
jgi:hypothetical protein